MKTYKMWIGGEWVDADSGETFRTYNPATGEVVAEVPRAGLSDVDKAVAAARNAFPAWRRKSQAERSAAVARIAEAVREHADELARLEILEHGACAWHAPLMMGFAAGNLDLAAAGARTCMGLVLPPAASKGDVPGAGPSTVAYMQREPVGVCALITPWNVPSLLISSKIGPSLATGNTCVLKPPSLNSGIGLKWAEILAGLDLPPGVVNVITGPGATIGEALASHPGVDLVSFTGSSEVGKAIIAASSATVKTLIMELGGKNPAIVLEDADVEGAAKELCAIAFENVGQNCAQPSRMYVQKNVYDRFVKAFVAAAEGIKVGLPADENTVMGPVVSAAQRDGIEKYIQWALDEGATLATGGARPAEPALQNGFFITPTVFTNVTEDMTITREEVFGPVVGIHKFSTDEQVLEAANDSVFGLCASVWTKDYARGLRMVNELQAGTVWINQHMNLAPETPWGGFKESGLAKEGGVIGAEGYTQLKLVYLKHV
ncbi:MAG: aldehyde dehydrogenase [Thermoleophilia bacterium]|nr:aldehyde dehydrogenase [Thermoleophilia bacterium]